MIALLLLACAPETVRQGDPEEVDLSGYATLEDLAALQAELDELRDELAATAAPTITALAAECGAGLASLKLDEPVEAVAGLLCVTVDDGEGSAAEQCRATSWLSQTANEGSALPYATLLLVEDTDCIVGEAWARWLVYAG